MNFMLEQMTFLRYFIPLILEGNSRGVRSTLYIDPRCNKYNSAVKHQHICRDLAKIVGFDVVMASDKKPSDGLSFLVEGCSRDLCGDTETASITYVTDFIGLGKDYRDSVDHILFPSEYIAKYYNCDWDNNLYLGNPKFDIHLDKNSVLKKYGLGDKKKVLIAFPRQRLASSLPLSQIYGMLKAMDYEVVVKSRGKDPVAGWYMGDAYFEDASWFPHDTMELMSMVDLLINFDSGTIEEAVHAKVPTINFEIKSFVPFKFLYDADYCYSTKALSEEAFIKKTVELTNSNYDKAFDESLRKITCESSSKKILDHFSIG
tara:strand:+ start:512 stop:1462 length:951 start_codon:yes stop_codon:yes gene_type:complete